MSGEMALDGVHVLDLSESIGGAYCTKLLADLGASVILVERPGSGHPLRGDGPLSKDPDIEGSGLFIYYGANKKSVVCDIETESGQRTVRDLASRADIVVESFAPGHLDALGLGYESLSALNPSLIMTSVTHFGQTGPYRHWKSDEIVDNAMGGYMYFMGHADREPLMMNNNQPMIHAGSQAAIATLTALWWMRKSGLRPARRRVFGRGYAVRPRVDVHCMDARGRHHPPFGTRLHTVQRRLGLVLHRGRFEPTYVHPDRPPRANRRPQDSRTARDGSTTSRPDYRSC